MSMGRFIPDGVFARHIAVLGKTRSGKSSVMRLFVEDLLEREKPVCIIDPKGDSWGLRASADGKKSGYPVVIFGGERAILEVVCAVCPDNVEREKITEQTEYQRSSQDTCLQHLKARQLVTCDRGEVRAAGMLFG